MTEKKIRKKLRKILVITFAVFACVGLFFPVRVLVKRINLYNECSKVEEYRTREKVSDPKEYGLDVNNLIITMMVWEYGTEKDYYLYIFGDGKVAMGTIIGVDNESAHAYAVKSLDNTTVWKNVDLVYLGRMSGRDLYSLIVLREKANFEADCYDADIEYWRLSEGIEPGPINMKSGAEVDPWITAINHNNGNDTYFFIEAADGIRYYIYDKNAHKMLWRIEDSWYFDQWMKAVYGDDWRSKVTIYRSEKDFVVK